jgi:hypothetical protein
LRVQLLDEVEEPFRTKCELIAKASFSLELATIQQSFVQAKTLRMDEVASKKFTLALSRSGVVLLVLPLC